MRKARFKLLFVIPVVVWAVFRLRHAVGDFAIADNGSGTILTTCGIALGLVSLVGCLFRQTRWAAVASVLILVALDLGAPSLRSHRLAVGVRQLEAIYLDIAESGPPFPESVDRKSYEGPAYLHWYYQKHSDQSFAIVYIVASDGWALEYPGAVWTWIGYQPEGYQPDKTPERYPTSQAAELKH